MTLTLKAYEPLISLGLYSREFIDDITENHEGYNHSVTVIGGYESSSFTLRGDTNYLEDWYENGLMRRIVFENDEGITGWEGFVATIEFSKGTVKKVKSIDNMYNRIYLRYSPADFSTYPPYISPSIDLIVDDSNSQIKYGIKSMTISGGERVDDTAYNWARTVLKDKKDVKEGAQDNILGSGDESLKITCKGYYHVLKWLPYISSVTTGYIKSHQVIQEILEYFNSVNPGWMNLDFNFMKFNYRNEARAHRDLDSCWDVIGNIISEGGMGGERWVGGLYQDRRFIYKPAEDFDSLYSLYSGYRRTISDTGQLIFDTNTGEEVKPWDVLPDRIIETTDFRLSGQKDQMYIEEVKFTEPNGLELFGGEDQRLKVFLAQKGLPGVN